MNCPICTDERLVLSARSGIEIDYCPACRGVWLDRGELDKVIERSSPSSRPQPARTDDRGDDRNRDDRDRSNRYDDDFDRSGQQRKPKSKTSFLGELFEFGAG